MHRCIPSINSNAGLGYINLYAEGKNPWTVSRFESFHFFTPSCLIDLIISSVAFPFLGFFLSLSFLPRFQGKQKVIEDGDLLRRALEKIESLESEMQRLRVSPSAASTPTPSPSTVPTPRDGKPKGTDKVDQHDEDDPIRTPDGVPVF